MRFGAPKATHSMSSIWAYSCAIWCSNTFSIWPLYWLAILTQYHTNVETREEDINLHFLHRTGIYGHSSFDIGSLQLQYTYRGLGRKRFRKCLPNFFYVVTFPSAKTAWIRQNIFSLCLVWSRLTVAVLQASMGFWIWWIWPAPTSCSGTHYSTLQLQPSIMTNYWEKHSQHSRICWVYNCNPSTIERGHSPQRDLSSCPSQQLGCICNAENWECN